MFAHSTIGATLCLVALATSLSSCRGGFFDNTRVRDHHGPRAGAAMHEGRPSDAMCRRFRAMHEPGSSNAEHATKEQQMGGMNPQQYHEHMEKMKQWCRDRAT